MSAALYKFLRKAVLQGEPGAEALAAKYTAKARSAIIDRLARIDAKPGRHLFEKMDPKDINGGDLLKRALKKAREANNQPFLQSDGDAKDLLLEWMTRPPKK